MTWPKRSRSISCSAWRSSARSRRFGLVSPTTAMYPPRSSSSIIRWTWRSSDLRAKCTLHNFWVNPVLATSQPNARSSAPRTLRRIFASLRQALAVATASVTQLVNCVATDMVYFLALAEMTASASKSILPGAPTVSSAGGYSKHSSRPKVLVSAVPEGVFLRCV